MKLKLTRLATATAISRMVYPAFRSLLSSHPAVAPCARKSKKDDGSGASEARRVGAPGSTLSFPQIR